MGVMTERDHEWRHNWVPLTLHAALLKAHGNHARAEELLAAAKGRRRRRKARRAEFVTPHPKHRAELEERRSLRAMTEEQLADAMGAPDVSDEELDGLVAELDRRERAERKAGRDRERRERRRSERDAAREAEAERLIAGGEDEAEAWRRAYGTTEEQERRQEAIRQLRGNGHRGRNFDQLARSYHREEVRQSVLRAEDATRGHLLNQLGRRAGINYRSLFEGPDARARKYASPELLAYWNANGRPTLEDTKSELLGGVRRQREDSDVAAA
jgi:hypothetical protein